METVSSENAPQAIGPYSQAVKANGFLFCSGQIALNKNGDIVGADAQAQTHQVMQNLFEVLKEAGSSFDKIVKTTIFLDNIENFQTVNEVYSSYFERHKPARSTVEVSRLPKDVMVEIDCIAII
jgi:2-iminobutanoate/2-iminopropanoate deaminase